MVWKPKGSLPVPTNKIVKVKKEGSLLTRMMKVLKENQTTRYCRRGMVEIFFPNLDEEKNKAEWTRAYWDVAKMFEIMFDDGQIAETKVKATIYCHWVGVG